MENDPELLKEISKIFEDARVRVKYVTEPLSRVDGKLITVYSRRCALDYKTDILKDIVDKNVTDVYLLSAEFIQIGEDKFATFRAAYMTVNKPVAMVDVDETVVPIVKKWVAWYHVLTGHSLALEMHKDGVAQDLLDLMHKHDEPMKFWRNPTLYHGMKPRRGCVEVLEELSKTHDIVFVSNSFSEHSDSKKLFLTKWFPFHKGYVATSEKKFIKADIFIDDYKNYLRKVQEYQPDCLCIQIKTHLSNKGEFPLLEWDEVLPYIKEHR